MLVLQLRCEKNHEKENLKKGTMEKRKIVIVGGVAGGATAAAKLRRLSEKDEIIIFEKD
jgi:cation diffusion facilitator CzcD-associated flavoprotein CzcO